MVIVSACLAGTGCKYNGKNNLDKYIQQLVSEGLAIPVCPEQLGGCSTPRPKTEIAGGTGADVLDGRAKVIRETGEYVTEEFIKGANEVLKLAKLVKAEKAILKSKSPSCGCGRIYNGTFSGVLQEGNGVTSELLMRNGIKVITEKELKTLEK